MIRKVLVTGSSKGIGKAVARQIAASGFHVTVHYAGDRAGAEATVTEIQNAGGQADFVGFNIADREQTRQVLNDYVNENGAFWGVVCNAGITRDGAFPALSEDDWDSVIHTNLDGFFNVVQPLLMPMIRLRQGGRIVGMSPVSGVAGNRGQVNYSASKAGLIGACKSLAIEVAKRGITVNCVAPGLIETGMVTEEVKKHAMDMIPMKRMGSVEEIAQTVDFLLSEGAGYITRQTISVNGGMC